MAEAGNHRRVCRSANTSATAAASPGSTGRTCTRGVATVRVGKAGTTSAVTVDTPPGPAEPCGRGDRHHRSRARIPDHGGGRRTDTGTRADGRSPRPAYRRRVTTRRLGILAGPTAHAPAQLH